MRLKRRLLIVSEFRFSFLFGHDLFRKPVSTFRDHVLIKAAIHHAGILRHVAIGNRGADRRRCCGRGGRWRRNGRRLGGSGRLDRALNRRRLLLGLGRGLAMSDELRIAGRARPGRHIGGHPAGPMRPMIGNKTAAAREMKPKYEQSRRCNKPPRSHRGCRISGARVKILTRRDG
jgi:hypothetical protein